MAANLEERVRGLENTRNLILALCLIFGVSGAWGYKLLLHARAQLNDLTEPTDKFAAAKAEALAKFKESATQEQNAQLAAFKAAAHNFTIEWETPVTPGVLGGNAANVDGFSLGKHDICIIAKTDYHIVTNAESSCSLSLENQDWKLSMRHDALVGINGSSTGCAVMCGNIK
jgi:hypothetical protein